MSRIGTGVYARERIALQRKGRGLIKVAVDAARKGRDRIVFEMKNIRLGGPTTPPHPSKGKFDRIGRLALRTGRLRASVKGSGIRGANVSPKGTSQSVEIIVKVGEGLPQTAIQEHGGIIRARRTPWLVFSIIGRDGRRHLVRVKMVRIPGRLGFAFTFRKVTKQTRIDMRAGVARAAIGRAG